MVTAADAAARRSGVAADGALGERHGTTFGVDAAAAEEAVLPLMVLFVSVTVPRRSETPPPEEEEEAVLPLMVLLVSVTVLPEG